MFTRKPRTGWVIFHEMEETKKTQWVAVRFYFYFSDRRVWALCNSATSGKKTVPLAFAFIRQHADPDVCRPDTAPDVIYGVILDVGCPGLAIPLVVILLIVERCLSVSGSLPKSSRTGECLDWERCRSELTLPASTMPNASLVCVGC